MSGQIIFFYKNKADFTSPSISATASEGDLYASNVMNRSNLNAWITTGSADANDTTLTIDMVDPKEVSDILLIKHNFKAFTVKYWDGSAYQDFSPAISETTNIKETSYYEVTSVNTQKIQVTITGTMTANQDKFLYQLIATTKIGRLAGWPLIKKPTVSRKRQKQVMLSGKVSVSENVGDFACTLNFTNFTSDADLTIVESLFDQSDGFLVWLCGGNETQFKTIRQSYRLEDIYLMKCTNDYMPEYSDGVYKDPITLVVALEEVIE